MTALLLEILYVYKVSFWSGVFVGMAVCVGAVVCVGTTVCVGVVVCVGTIVCVGVAAAVGKAVPVAAMVAVGAFVTGPAVGATVVEITVVGMLLGTSSVSTGADDSTSVNVSVGKAERITLLRFFEGRNMLARSTMISKMAVGTRILYHLHSTVELEGATPTTSSCLKHAGQNVDEIGNSSPHDGQCLVSMIRS